MDILSVPQGTLSLSRFPRQNKETLRAWDAADEYILQHLAEQQLLTPGSKVLILNDSFGALCVALSDTAPIVMSDSYIAQQGCIANLKDNKIPLQQACIINSLSPLEDFLSTPSTAFDLVIIKITKSLAQLEDQLHRVRPFLNNDSKVIAAGMVKGIHTSTLNLFEKIIGPTHTSLAQKKSRLIFSKLDSQLTPPENSYPKHYVLEGTQYKITNHANVFSREKLDIGSRFFIHNIPASNSYRSIVDLGCGNGIIGLIAADKNPQAHITFVDESHMAIASARENFQRAFASRKADFKVTDCLEGIAENSSDLILNNPPFHQQNTIGDFIAWQMFKESKKVLKPGGELWVIGNRHLKYHIKLKRLFGNCETIVSNSKFIILKSTKIE